MKNGKRLSAIILALLISLITAIPAVAAPVQTFQDVPANHAAAEAIAWVSSPANGAFMVGDMSNNFNPNRNLNVFEAAQIFARAGGFRHISPAVPEAEAAMLTRSFNTWRPFLDGMAEQFSNWNRAMDREIAFLLYHSVLEAADVSGFMTMSGQNQVVSLMTREQAIAWVVRHSGNRAQAHAVTLPAANPFNDDAIISAQFRRYIYFARNRGFIPAGGDARPQSSVTRAELATLFFNALATADDTPQTLPPGQTITAISGLIEAIPTATHINIRNNAGLHSVRVQSDAVILIENVRLPFASLQVGMHVTALLNPAREIISLVARPGTPADQVGSGQPPGLPPTLVLYNDEGIVTAVAQAARTVTIRVQRVRIDGQVVNEERTFNIAQNATIVRGGHVANLASVQVGDMAFFRFGGGSLYELILVERDRSFTGTLIESRPADSITTFPSLTIQLADDRVYVFRVTAATTVTRNGVPNLNWSDIRIGDTVTVNAEYDRLVSVQATGTVSTVNGRLLEMSIRERNSELTVVLDTGGTVSYVVMPGVFDIYTLRIGQNLRITLDSREVTHIQLVGANLLQTTSFIGYIQAFNADDTITVVEGQGATRRTVVLTLNNNTVISRAGVVVHRNQLRVNMNVHVMLTAPQSNIAQSITILP